MTFGFRKVFLRQLAKLDGGLNENMLKASILWCKVQRRYCRLLLETCRVIKN